MPFYKEKVCIFADKYVIKHVFIENSVNKIYNINIYHYET